MKFCIVIGNPPYNDDLYIDFVELGQRLSKICSVWITPAKWVSKLGDKNLSFRSNVVPYISDVIYYPDHKNIFDIAIHCGISYYLCDKTMHKEKRIENICTDFEEFNSVEYRSINKTLLNSGNSLLMRIQRDDMEYLDTFLNLKRSFYTSEYCIGSPVKVKEDDVKVFAGREGFKGYIARKDLYTEEGLDKYKVTISKMTGGADMCKDGNMLVLNDTYIIEPYCVPQGAFHIFQFFETLDEAESFRSYINTKLARFLYYISLQGSNVNKFCFRYVPKPKKFDHLFSDSEVYKLYNVSETDKNFIEKLIKSRGIS